MVELAVPQRFLRSADTDQEKTIQNARVSLSRLAEVMGTADLGEVDLLDMGCGVKFTQALLRYELPIRSYVGVDVFGDMIDFLREEVRDPRFEYHHLPVRNELYNPGAPPMTADADIGVGDRTFDLISLFSVFTHLDPTDFAIMLELMARYARPDARIAFTAFLDELTPGGHGFLDQWSRRLAERTGTALPDPGANALREVVPYRDADPARPLMYALYSRDYTTELVDDSPWELVEIQDPAPDSQHLFVCRLAS